MGCCYSCDDGSSTQAGDVNERSRLLGDPVRNNTPVPRGSSDDFCSRYPSSLPKRTDEQSAMSKILHETATNIIDVAALDTHNFEQHEYLDRARQYNHRLQNLIGAAVQTSQAVLHKYSLLEDIPAVETVLSTDPILYSDMTMITGALEKVVNALSEVKVEHKEDLVVPFGIP